MENDFFVFGGGGNNMSQNNKSLWEVKKTERDNVRNKHNSFWLLSLDVPKPNKDKVSKETQTDHTTLVFLLERPSVVTW